MKLTFRGGIHPPGHKALTREQEITVLASVEKVYLPLKQHTGAPCTPLVKVGDMVKKGQKIAEGQGFVSAPVHASVSGQVIAVEEMPILTGEFVPCLVIQNDSRDEWHDSVRPQHNPEKLTPAQLRDIVREAGIVGLGGATFPTHVKYAVPEGKSIQSVIINGAECEPYLTSDYRLMLEAPELIIRGLQYIMKMVNCNQGIIAIEDNKMDAYELMREKALPYEHISVVACKTKYPQGSEKQLIYACTGKELPFGKLPLDLGVLVNNVGTAAAICNAVEKGIPLVSRVVTVSGDGIKNPGNYLVPIGTLFKDLLVQCGGFTGEVEKIIAGGPMMGKAVYTYETPVIKGTSGILVMKRAAAKDNKERNCVRCAKCISACPLRLRPTTLATLAKYNKWADLEVNKVMHCIECGSCAYVCPAHIPIVQYIRRGKQEIAKAKAKAAQ